MIGLGGMITGAGRKGAGGGGGRGARSLRSWSFRNHIVLRMWLGFPVLECSELNRCSSEPQSCFGELGPDSRDRVVSPTTCSFAASFPTLDSLRRVGRRRSMQGRQGS